MLRNERQNYWGMKTVESKLCAGTRVQSEPALSAAYGSCAVHSVSLSVSSLEGVNLGGMV